MRERLDVDLARRRPTVHNSLCREAVSEPASESTPPLLAGNGQRDSILCISPDTRVRRGGYNNIMAMIASAVLLPRRTVGFPG